MAKDTASDENIALGTVQNADCDTQKKGLLGQPTKNGKPSSTLRLSACAFVIAGISLLNIVVLIWVPLHRGLLDGYGIIANIGCERAESIQSGLHLVINVLSTLILAATNFCMQCVAAPSRVEVDKVHSEGKSLDIGVQSVRNLRYIPNKRAFIWCLLGLTSLLCT
jgi:hypothetical protein